MSLSLRAFLRRCFRGGIFLSVAWAAMAQNKPADPIIELPKIVVTDSRELPPPEAWRYASIPGFEVLTNASNRDTDRLIRDFQSFNFAVDVVWRGLQQKNTVPVSLIICGRGGKFDAFVSGKDGQVDIARASLLLQEREQTAIVIDFEAKTINLSGLAGDIGTAAPTVSAPGDSTDSGTPGNTGQMEVNANKQLYREYIRYLMSRAQPRLPPWFEEGLSQLFMGMTFDKTTITFAKLEDPNTTSISGAAEDNDFNKALEGRALIPLQEFFTVERNSATALNPLGSTWAKQAQAFVHLCLYGEQQKYQKSLFSFLMRSQKEPVTEALFKECFNKSYKDMLLTLRSYQQFAAYKSLEWHVPKGVTIPDPPPLALRDATESEIGRIKGDALRLAGRADAAHVALIAPYIRGERDPRLLAALGLEERAAGHDDRAEKFLEAAVVAKVDRSRAYLELARIRYGAAVAAPGGAEGRLSPAQVNRVVEPLFAGRSQPPELAEVYELIVDAYARSAVVPKKEELQAMFDGVNLFRGRLGLAYQTAVLCLRAGEIKGATTLVEHGLRLAPDESSRSRFAALKATLPPVPAAVPSAQPKS